MHRGSRGALTSLAAMLACDWGRSPETDLRGYTVEVPGAWQLSAPTSQSTRCEREAFR